MNYLGLWRGWKGHIVLVVGVHNDSEMMTNRIEYYELTDRFGHVNANPPKHSRPEAMWSEHVNKDGYSGPRFRRIEHDGEFVALVADS